MTKKILRLDALMDAVAGEMDFKGKQHNVLQPTVAQQQIMTAAEATPTAENVDALHKTIRALVPTLSDEDFGKLNNDALVAITLLAGANVELVEKVFPNAVSPATVQTSPG